MAGNRHSEKCTKEEAQAFRIKVKNFLDEEKLPYQKIIALTCYLGQAKIFTGGEQERLRLRQGRKLVAFKTPNGTYEGEPETITRLIETGGTSIYLKTSEPIIEKEYLPVYRVDDWEEEKEYLKKHLSQNKV